MTLPKITFNNIKDILLAVWSDFTTKKVLVSASSLTYSTILAITPILAVVFAIARGFGYNIYIEEWFRDILKAQPEACEIIIGFVNSYLINTKKGLFLGIGLIFMLWTVTMLIANIETTFNDIWSVKKQRSYFRTFTDYIALIFCVPIFIVLSSGINIWVQAFNSQVTEIILIGPMTKFFIELTPYVLTSIVFIALYAFMPNTKVHLRSTIVPGILAGVAMQLFQLLYINSQIWVTSYNAIYGSFAIIPLFMLWVQISWIIILVGAELSYTVQNQEEFLRPLKNIVLNHKTRITLSAHIMSLVTKQFENGGEALTAMQLKEELNIQMRIVSNLIYDLQKIHFLTEISHDDKGEDIHYQPAEALSKLTIGEMVKRLNSLGDEINTGTMTKSETWKQVSNLHNEFIDSTNRLSLKDV